MSCSQHQGGVHQHLHGEAIRYGIGIGWCLVCCHGNWHVGVSVTTKIVVLYWKHVTLPPVCPSHMIHCLLQVSEGDVGA